MNKKNVEVLIKRLKEDLAALENELINEQVPKNIVLRVADKDKDYKKMHYHVEYENQEYGGKKGFNKRDVFKFIISEELKRKSVEELNNIFALKYFPKVAIFAVYPYVIEEKQLPNFPKSIQKKYLNVNNGTAKGKNVYVLGEWAQFGNIEEQTPGNFPVLIRIAKKLGYKVKVVIK